MPARPTKTPTWNSRPVKRRGDDADAVDLGDHVGEGAEDGRKHADQARQVAAEAGAEEVRNRELAELAQVGRQQQGHQAVAAGPAQHEGEAVVAGQVERAGHADEAGGRHPVGAGRHAVEQRRHAPAGDVVLADIRRLRHEADAGVQHDGREQEDVAENLVRHAHLFEDADQDDEGNETAGIEAVIALQVGSELRLGDLSGHVSRAPLHGRRIPCPGCSCNRRSRR
jgi:hypothetical protein